MIPLKAAAIEDALDMATIRLGIYTLIANIQLQLDLLQARKKT